jgi:cell division transport system permease protein
VLFLLGFLGLFVINSKKLTDNFKENFALTVFFKNEANDSIIKAFDQELKTANFVKNFEYVDKETAAKKHMADIGEDYMSFLGENPLQNSFDIHPKAAYITNDSIRKIEAHLKQNPMVADVYFDRQFVDLVNKNIDKISFYILCISGFLAVVSILLINSSMRLSIYSNRFIIKTMQMVGATKSFIRKPFIWRSIKLGIIGSVLAVAALVGVLFYANNNLTQVDLLEDPLMTGLVLLGVIVAGIIITWISTFIATQRFLNLRTDDLY